MAQLFTLILFLFYSLNHVASDEYYIVANSTDLCSSSCLTLTEFVTNFSYLSAHNITITFSPGVHYLNDSLVVSDLGTFSMTSDNKTAQIECTSYSQMIFNYTRNIFVTNLQFVGCGSNQVMDVENFIIHDTTFIGQNNRGITLQLTRTTGKIMNCDFLSLHWSGTINWWCNHCNQQ